MLEHLEKWMYVNDVKNEKLLFVASVIEQTGHEPIIFTSKGEILYYFWKLIKGKISLEQFYLFNDTFFSSKTYNYLLTNGVDTLDYVKFNHKKNKIYVLDILFDQKLDFNNIYFI